MKYYIYTLSHPLTEEIRYIGKTNNLSKRYSAHLKDKCKSHKTSWIKSLLSENLKPKLEILEEFTDEDECYKFEIYWISQFKTWGFTLVNLLDGGRGSSKKGKRFKKNRNKKSDTFIIKPNSRTISDELAIKIITDLKLGKSVMCITETYNVGRGLVEGIKILRSWKDLSIKLNYLGLKKQKNKIIEQCTINGTFISRYDSITIASNKTGIPRYHIRDCLQNKIKNPQFMWKYWTL